MYIIYRTRERIFSSCLISWNLRVNFVYKGERERGRELERERETYPLLSWNRKVHILSGESDILRLSSTSTCHHHSTHGMRTGVFHSFYCMILIISPLLHILLTRFVWRLIYRYKERQQKCNLSSCC